MEGVPTARYQNLLVLQVVGGQLENEEGICGVIQTERKEGET